MNPDYMFQTAEHSEGNKKTKKFFPLREKKYINFIPNTLYVYRAYSWFVRAGLGGYVYSPFVRISLIT